MSYIVNGKIIRSITMRTIGRCVSQRKYSVIQIYIWVRMSDMIKRIFTLIIIFIMTISVGGCKNKDTEGDAKSTVTVSQNTNLPPAQEPALGSDSSKGNSSLFQTMKKEDYPIVDGSTATIPL